MSFNESRWKQRFQNFEKAFSFLQDIVAKKEYTAIEISGLTNAFEFTFELGWKTIKDFLFEQGIELSFPREIIKEAFKTGIIADGHIWMEMLEKRNELSHTYNEDVAKNAVEAINNKYFSAIQQVYYYFKDKFNG